MAWPGFSSQVNLATGTHAFAVAAGDINGDGIGDILAANFTATGSISVFLGNGNGTFVSKGTFAVGGGYPQCIALADVNGDGNLDALVGVGNNIEVLLGNGNGTFGAGTAFAAGGSTSALAVVDINNDGKLDVVCASGTHVAVLLGNGNGTFGTATTFAAVTGGSIRGLAVGDVNGDGNKDVVVNDYTAHAVVVLLGNGNGTLQAPRTFACGSSGASPQGVTLADFNGDGFLDIAASNYGDTNIGILLGNGNGTFKPVSNVVTIYRAHACVATDIDGDGRVDLAAAEYTGGKVGLLLGNGNGTFAADMNFGTGVRAWGIAAVDVMGDGVPGVAWTGYSTNNVGVLMNLLVPTRNRGIRVGPRL
jgi:hypothetical protein